MWFALWTVAMLLNLRRGPKTLLSDSVTWRARCDSAAIWPSSYPKRPWKRRAEATATAMWAATTRPRSPSFNTRRPQAQDVHLGRLGHVFKVPLKS